MIGTSTGEFYKDAMEFHTRSRPSNDPIAADPSGLTSDVNEKKPDNMMRDIKDNKDPDNITNDAGDLMDMSTPQQRQPLYDKNKSPIEDRRNESFFDFLKSFIGQQFTQDKFDAVKKYPALSTMDRALAVNADQYYGTGDLPIRGATKLGNELGYSDIKIPEAAPKENRVLFENKHLSITDEDIDKGIGIALGASPGGARGPRKYFNPGEAESAYKAQSAASVERIKNRAADIRATRDQPETSSFVKVLNQLVDKIKAGNATDTEINLHNALADHIKSLQ